MELTNDEYAAVIQSYDPSLQGSQNLSQKIQFDSASRYMDFARRNPDINMSQQDFESFRKCHIAQLFTAYKEEYDGTASNHQKWLGSATTTDPSIIRRVLGNRTGGAEYNGPMVLDEQTIAAVCHIASIRGMGNRYFDHEWVNKLDYMSLTNVVDEMISTKNILLETSHILENEKNPNTKYGLMMGTTFYKETGIAKRAIENQVSSYSFDKIQHAETAQEFSQRKTNVFSKIASKFKNFFEKLENPQEYEKKQSEIGNQAFEGR